MSRRKKQQDEIVPVELRAIVNQLVEKYGRSLVVAIANGCVTADARFTDRAHAPAPGRRQAIESYLNEQSELSSDKESDGWQIADAVYALAREVAKLNLPDASQDISEAGVAVERGLSDIAQVLGEMNVRRQAD